MRRGADLTDAAVAAALRDLAAARAPATLCPSEVARALAENWRPLIPQVRAVAASLSDIVATQGGAPVDAETARGPIRLALRPAR